MNRWFWAISLLCCLPSMLLAQGLPSVHHYDSETTGSFPQNWNIEQDSSGYLYFGNHAEAIVRFDGKNWPGKHILGTGAIRSLSHFNSKIFWGGVGDFGYIKSDSLNDFSLYSLLEKVDSVHRTFDDVWQIVESEGKLYYRASGKLYQFSKDTIQVVESSYEIRDLHTMGESLIVQTRHDGLKQIVNNQFTDLPGSERFAGDRLAAVHQDGSEYIFIFRQNGFVRYDGNEFTSIPTEADDYLQNNSLYKSVAINDHELAIATLYGGIVLMGKDGTIKNILSKENVLPTNVIYDLFFDHEKTLWATSNDGIISTSIENPVTFLGESSGLSGLPTMIEVFNSIIYFGSTDGLFYVNDNEVRKHEDIHSYIRDGIVINGFLYLTTADGLFVVEKEKATQLSDHSYSHLKNINDKENIFYGSLEHSIEELTIFENRIQSREVLQTDNEIRNFFVEENGIWVVTYHNEVFFKSWGSNRVKTYELNLLEDSAIRNLDIIDNSLWLATDSGLYIYDKLTDSFEKDTLFTDREMQTEQVFTFTECPNGDVWIRNNQKVKRAVREGNLWETTETPYYTIGSRGTVEQIHCNNDGSVWFGGSEGIYHLSDPDWTYDHDFNTNLTGVLIHNDSLIYGGYGDPAEIKELKFEENELRFTYAAASYIVPEANEYRTRLRGYEEEWSNWSGEPQKDYTFIPEGTYTFEVQGRNVYHKTGSIDSYTFIVLPPWYRTIWAYFGYLVVLGGMVYAGHRIRINSILKEQRIRDGIARDLHDELSSTLSSINFFANAMDSPKMAKDEGNRFLALIKKSSLEAKEKISDIVWVIHTENDDWENLLMRCKRFASDILDARDIKHLFEINGTFSGKPSITQKKNIWLIFREIITNIARHAEPHEVNIRFGYNSGKLHIHIEDDGIGFDPENTREGGYGVQNIKERAQQMKGKCTLESMPGEGTRWVIDVPVA